MNKVEGHDERWILFPGSCFNIHNTWDGGGYKL